MESAAQTIYWFRVSYGLEDSVYGYPYSMPFIMDDESAEATVEEPALATLLARVKLSADKEATEITAEEPLTNWDINYEDYQMCSYNTQNLVNIYQNYVGSVKWDNRIREMYPLLDRIEDWIREEYRESGDLVEDDDDETIVEPL